MTGTCYIGSSCEIDFYFKTARNNMFKCYNKLTNYFVKTAVYQQSVSNGSIDFMLYVSYETYANARGEEQDFHMFLQKAKVRKY